MTAASSQAGSVNASYRAAGDCGQVEKRQTAVGLRVEIDEQRFAPAHGQCCGKVDGGRGLSDAPLLIGDRDDHRYVLKADASACNDEGIVGTAVGIVNG